MRIITLIAASCCVALATTSGALWAQSAADASAGEGSSPAPSGAFASAAMEETPDLGALSLVDLLDMKIETASKTEEAVKLAPSNVTVVTRQQILEWGARDLKDVLRRVAGFLVIYDRDEWVFSARGNVSDNNQKYLLLVDGHRMNSYENFGPGQTIEPPMDLANVRRIEIIRGPGSAVWGSEALAGVINIITLEPEDMVEHPTQGAVTWGMDRTFRANLQLGREYDDRVGAVLSGAFVRSDGTPIEADAPTGLAKPYWMYAYCRDEPCIVDGPGANQAPPFGRYVTRLDQHEPGYMVQFKGRARAFGVNAFALHNRVKLRHFEDNDFRTTPSGAALDRKQWLGNDRLFVEGSWQETLGAVQLTAKAGADLIEAHYLPLGDPSLFIQWRESRFQSSFGARADALRGRVTIIGGGDFAWTTFGPSLRMNTLNPRTTADTTTHDTDGLVTELGEDNQFGAYAIATLHLLDALHVTGGGRLDYDADRGDDPLTASPRAAVAYELTDDAVAKVVYNTGLLRPANFQTSTFPVSPEKMRQVEAIAMFGGQPVTVTLTAFWQQLDGIILIRESQAASGSYQTGFANTGDYESVGVELEALAQLGPHHVWGNLSLAQPRGKDFASGLALDSMRIEPDEPGVQEGRLLNYPTLMFNVGGAARIVDRVLVAPALRYVGAMPYRSAPPQATLDDASYADSEPLLFLDLTYGIEPNDYVGIYVSGNNLLGERGPAPISVWNGTHELYGRYVEATLRVRY